MGKVFQPIVLKRAEEFIETLKSIDFFVENDIECSDYTKTYLCEVLTQKFIDGGDLYSEFDEMFTDQEGEKILGHIIVGTVLNDLKEKGILDSYEDENTEEVYFFTELGKKMSENGELY